jgi:hypothetical protein
MRRAQRGTASHRSASDADSVHLRRKASAAIGRDTGHAGGMSLLQPEFLDLCRGFDIDAFWEENRRCAAPGPGRVRCHAKGVGPDDHWMFEFLGGVQTVRYYHDKAYRDDLHRQTNAIMHEHLRVRPYDEDSWRTQPRRIENLFGCEFAYHEGGTPWFVPVTDDPAAFARILDAVERIDIESWCLPDDYLAEWEERKAAGKRLPHLGTGGRGPATVMTSVIAPETLLVWCIDEPELIDRFSRILAASYVRLARRLRAFSGCTWNGWWITDDNCCLFNPRHYRRFCAPVLRALLDAFTSGPEAFRFQHSDSAMAHHLDTQRELGIGQVNYGPEIDVALIRQKMPEAVIDGHTPPFLLRNGTPDEIRQRVREDFRKAGAGGRLNVCTAGSIPGGTGIGRLKFYLKTIAEETRYADAPA